MSRRAALIIVDVQNDFLPSGALPVADGDRIIPIVNKLQGVFDLVVATQDWHPRDHGSFAANHRGKLPGDVVKLNGLRQVLWQVHCVQETLGALLAPTLDVSRVKKVFRKGTDPWIDSYSAFFDNGHRKATGLARYLKSQQVTDVYVAGLATDYCVKFSATDALKLGFDVHLIEDACRGVKLKPGDVDRAIEQMQIAGVAITTSSRVLAEFRSRRAKSVISHSRAKVQLKSAAMRRDRAIPALRKAVKP